MSFREEVKNMSNEELIDRIRVCSYNSYYGAVWTEAIYELEIRLGIRLGTKSKEINERRTMKYCSFCGCYIPDDWDNCPACGMENYTLDSIYSNKTILNNERFYPYYVGLYSSSEFK